MWPLPRGLGLTVIIWQKVRLLKNFNRARILNIDHNYLSFYRCEIVNEYKNVLDQKNVNHNIKIYSNFPNISGHFDRHKNQDDRH